MAKKVLSKEQQSELHLLRALLGTMSSEEALAAAVEFEQQTPSFQSMYAREKWVERKEHYLQYAVLLELTGK